MNKIKIDYVFLFSVLALTAIGLIMILSASPTMGLKFGDTYFYIKRHIFYLLLGFSALYFGLHLDLKVLRRFAGGIFLFSLFLLLLVYIPGVGMKISGASRWIDLMIFTFQPSELLKFTTVLLLASLLSNWLEKVKDLFGGFLPILGLVCLIAAVIIKQPDLGTAVLLVTTAFVMLFLAGANLWHIVFMGGLGFMTALTLSLTSPYRMRRLVAYLNPWKDPQGVGFHIIQSLLAIGSGGMFGLGLGASRQKFFYLPQQFTDFIYAILCEELGFIGGVVVVILFIVFTVRGLRIAFASQNQFNSLLAAGLVAWISMQALINIMVVVGLLPTTGIPLPFISYGGTATIVSLFSVGIVLNISGAKK